MSLCTRALIPLAFLSLLAVVASSCGGTTVSEPSAHGLLLHDRPREARSAQWRLPPLVPPDLEAAEALSLGAEEALAMLTPEEQLRFWERVLGHGPPRPTDAGPGPERLREELGRLREALGADEPAMLALFVGYEPVARVLRRVPAHRPTPTLQTVLRRLPKRRRKAAAPVEEALRLSTLYGLSWPVERSHRISSRFGYRFHPVKRKAHLHRGVDVAVPIGTPVKAPAAGKVKRVRVDARNGRWLELDHGYGITTVYCHSSEIKVRRGQKVEAGTVVALSGNTGRTTGPHLHYQLHVATEPVDPLVIRERSGRQSLQARRDRLEVRIEETRAAQDERAAQGPL